MYYTRNCYDNTKNTYFNYSNYPNKYKILKNDFLFNTSSYNPKTFVIKQNKSFKLEREEEKVNKEQNKEKNKSLLFNQIFLLESQISELQNKVCELNAENINMNKDKKQLKNYEQIIKVQREDAKKAENIIFKLNQEINYLKKSYDKNLLYISKLKKMNNQNSETNYTHRDKFPLKLNQKEGIFYDIDNDHFFNELKKDNEKLNTFKDNSEEKKYKKNCNDILFRINDENGKENVINLSDNKNKNISLFGEVSSKDNTIDKNNKDNNNILYNKNSFNKMKGSDINSIQNKQSSYFITNGEANSYLLF
jgi:hypothetical protein